jgi:very-short-patch-repair endonuclease
MEPFSLVGKLASEQDGVVTMAQAVGAGLLKHQVDSLCRAGRWRRLALGGYLVDADQLPVTPRRALIRATVAALGPAAVAVLETAAELHGIAGLRNSEQIHVSVPADDPRAQRRHSERVVIHQLTLSEGSVAAVAGIRATTPVKTVADLILRINRYQAVSVLDSALNRGLLSPADLAAMPTLMRGRRGAVSGRRHLAEADGRAESPLETRVRLRCVDGKVAPDALQYEVRDEDGYLLAVADLAWPRARVLAEADGRAPHGTPDAVFADRRRQNLLVNAGWTVLRFTWADTLRPDYIPYTVSKAIAAAAPGR